MWEQCRDFVEGSDSVKKHSLKYLPKPEAMSDEEYKGYVKRAEFCPYVTRTLDGIHGLMFRKPLRIEVPEGLLQYLENVDGKGSNLDKFINDATYDNLITAWGGVLIDAPQGMDISQKLAEEEGIYPYLLYYNAEKIINVQTETVGRREKPVLIVLKEEVEVNEPSDIYTTTTKERYRELRIEKDTGYYKESVYDDMGVLISETYPQKFGKPMTSIPFYFITGTTPLIPIIKPLVDVNEAWFHKSADLENGAHWTGVPTPYCVGYEPETVIDDSGNAVPKDKLKLGGSQFIYFPMGVTSVGYLEFSGAGLSQLITMMDNDEERMAILGARIISQEKKGVESSETARIHRAGENSVIATFANECSGIFTKIIKEYLEWTVGHEITETISINISTDYDVGTMSPAELTALVSLWQQGGISKKILFNNLKEGEIIENNITFEDMEDEIAEEKAKVPDINNEGVE